MSRKSKSVETKSRLVVAKGWMRKMKGKGGAFWGVCVKMF